jgi:GWxTD domain-containing protein
MQMKRLTLFIILFLALIFIIPNRPSTAAEHGKTDVWKLWLEEVEPIMTRQELSVAKMLQTVEEQKRFQELFWKARDPSPHVPPNEYQIEYYRRRDYAIRRLGGVHTDRGQIYILLGEPFDIDRFSGYENLVECEMWEYRTDGRHGLLPFMNIVFYKPRDMGDFQLFHPGIHKPRDLLSAYYAGNASTETQAFSEIKKSSTALAQASLSMLPDEGEPGQMSLSSSNFALNKIYSLPEKEAESGYIRSFKSPGGSVEVSHTTNEIRGYGYFALMRKKGVTFLNYAVMPEKLNLKHSSENEYTAEIEILITAEDQSGKDIFQDSKKINLKIDTQRKQQIDKRRIAFLNLIPLIDGDFNITVAYMNKTTEEFFTYNERVKVSKDEPAAALGFQLKPAETPNFIPFAADKFLVLIDPRFTFNQKDALEGIVWGPGEPTVFLESITGENKITVGPIVADEGHYRFRLPLAEIKDDNYMLIIRTPGGGEYSRKIHVLPFYIDLERPVTMAKPEPAGAINNYVFIEAQQFMNAGDPNQAVLYFEKIPPQFRNETTLPIIAKAYYEKKDYARVMELLEKDEVKKVYATLIMLANSSIELKQYEKALNYLEQLRKYGDSVQVNQLLAATCLSLGRLEKARQYYEHAKKLMQK